MGLLPDVAKDLAVSISTAGRLVTAYAIGIAIGGPLLAIATARFRRKRALSVLLVVFATGNILCAVASGYEVLLIARIVTAVGQGAFFGIGAVLAASLVSDDKKASAIATMFAGLTIANVIGVPAGTALGHLAGWRLPFLIIAGLALVALGLLIWVVPGRDDEDKVNLAAELSALSDGRVWAALGTTVLFTSAIFPLFTYIAPMLQDLSHVSPRGITISLVLVGLGLTVGNVLGGRLADWDVSRSLIGIAATIAVVSLSLRWTSSNLFTAEINWIVWGVVTFAPIPMLQVNVMRFGAAAPNLVSTLNISAFNVGIALGAWLGGEVLDAGCTLSDIFVGAAIVSVAALVAVTATEAVLQKAASR